MSKADGVKHSGGCQCGAVRYAMLREPNPPSICHCRMCQKAVGGPFAVFAGIATDSLKWTRGAPTIVQTSPVSERGFCAACGTPLTYAATGNDRTSITMYSLDNPAAISAPHRHIGVESRADWLNSISDLPCVTTEEASGGDFLTACKTYQHPDHDTPADWTPTVARKDA